MDIGVDQYLLDNRLTLSGGFFWNHYRDMIVAQESLAVCGLSPFGPFAAFCAQNIGAVSTKGWEASVKYAVVKRCALDQKPGCASPVHQYADQESRWSNLVTGCPVYRSINGA